MRTVTWHHCSWLIHFNPSARSFSLSAKRPGAAFFQVVQGHRMGLSSRSVISTPVMSLVPYSAALQRLLCLTLLAPSHTSFTGEKLGRILIPTLRKANKMKGKTKEIGAYKLTKGHRVTQLLSETACPGFSLSTKTFPQHPLACLGE